ncbi:hypothetical protein BV25DRAFT_1895100 [Artomyces pyxidatus]|uniref:Uncharacterized protein n=1 Tax=Artomyces pyxidatus TaxID=48021 RepID=A0ACB8SIE3_9AGAM|nr:hypothetical protein BV25DRAFT_1895100 [Artomyces pyxidatus]
MASLDSTTNSLGLDLENLKLADPAVPAPDPVEQPTEHSSPSANPDEPTKDDESKAGAARKRNPYINPERVKTGGAQRDKLTDEELADRMARMREQNEKIKQRRMDVQADEDAFKKTQAEERVKQAKTRKVQETIDRTREQNARRKMEKIQSREWDSEKKGDAQWSKAQPTKPNATASVGDPGSGGRGNARGRGGGSGRGQGRGRGRGRGGSEGANKRTEGGEAVSASPKPASASTPAPTS